MNCRIGSFVFTIITFCITGLPHCCGQGLIFSLPEDGSGVEYEGTVIQETVRPDLQDGREILTWSRELSIKSVGREHTEYNGELQPCRWIEIKVVTGTSGATGIDAGPVGARIYKVLVPENKVMSLAVDGESIPNAVLPIVKGFRRLGEEQVEQINSHGLVVYPTLCLLANYESPTEISESETVDSVSGQENFDSRHMKGETIRERPDSRSTNTGEFWVSQDVPFGLAGWSVRVVRELKGSTEERTKFRQISSINSEMKVQNILEAAESELITE
ncbi:MAG: hypothetical protein MK110_02580 [Fuerstiella sp.]|nr:hypothetical protein [Fuerstiella sp.]